MNQRSLNVYCPPTIIDRCSRGTTYDNSYDTFVARRAPRAPQAFWSVQNDSWKPWVAPTTFDSRKTNWSWRARDIFALKCMDEYI